MAEIGNDIEKAKELLTAGQIVAIPTETVYGLAGNALNDDAILKIFEAKNRPKFDPLIAHVDTIDKVEKIVQTIPEEAKRLAENFWPGPLTMLLEKQSHVPDLLTSGLSRVAVRIPQHPITRRLLQSLDFPLAAPSANPFGYVSPTRAAHVEAQLGDKLKYILDGGSSEVGVESTILGFENEQVVVYRLGGTSLEEIEALVGKVKVSINQSSNPSAPGMLKSHYSPGRKMIIGDIASNLENIDRKSVGVISFDKSYDMPDKNQFILSEKRNLEEAARNIFTALRKMDQPHIDLILAEYLPDHGLGKAINDRLQRAAVN